MRTVLVLLCGLALLGAAGCATGGGVQIAGPASQVTPPPPPPTVPSGTPASADPVAVLRADPQVSESVKAALTPCAGGYYPIEDRYADLTHDGTAELLLTVSFCDYTLDEKLGVEAGGAARPQARYSGGVGGYAIFVYNLVTDPPSRLFGAEDSSVEMLVPQDASGASGDLIVLHNRWAEQDDPCCPSNYAMVMYRWDGTKFVEATK